MQLRQGKQLSTAKSGSTQQTLSVSKTKGFATIFKEQKDEAIQGKVVPNTKKATQNWLQVIKRISLL